MKAYTRITYANLTIETPKILGSAGYNVVHPRDEGPRAAHTSFDL
jgi:hypothetical protein